ncbi:sugar/pyridoxal phosphate phosphatase YigL [Candidatus Williamhamiltonella defendens]|uniref:sugar/pyridoxal phosphate phosphatase YigL n=1 Tax=Candidatus Williamhamiltonella defendens TaxID=138072 RepID=UPI00130DDA5F|nr:sugar/pyridoxal phosphate phosphatase YigL [Candidatus Hamiltonella defensa]
MYHIVASDLDGTLLLPNHTLSTYTKKVLKSLAERDIHFVFSTGRHHIDVSQIRDNLGIKAFMITSNGARVHDPGDELIYTGNLDDDIARDLYEIEYTNPDIITNVYRNDGWHVSRESPEQADFFRESLFHYQLFSPDTLKTEGVCKVYFVCYDHQKLLLLEKAMNLRWGDRVNVSFSVPHCLEVMGGGVSKGHALKQVAKILGYSLEECIAFGDGMNDLEMLSMVKKGCMMSNSYPRLKHLLPKMEVIGSNMDNAVANYLQKLFLKTPLMTKQLTNK